MSQNTIRCINVSKNIIRFFPKESAFDANFQNSTGFFPDEITEISTEQKIDTNDNDKKIEDDQGDDLFPLEINQEDSGEEVAPSTKSDEVMKPPIRRVSSSLSKKK